MGSGIQIVDWGDFNANHEYRYEFIATTTSIGFVISDWWSDWYGPSYANQGGMYDNGGALTVSISTEDECTVSDLTPITDPEAQAFEAAARQRTVPPESLFPPFVDGILNLSIGYLQVDLALELNLHTTRSSGYRPPAYQAHLYELLTKLIEIRNAIQRDPTQEDSCADLHDTIYEEIDDLHRINRAPKPDGTPDPDGLPTVNQSGRTLHELRPSQAVDLSPKSQLERSSLAQTIDQLARVNNLWRPNCNASNCRDPVHFARLGVSSPQNVRVLMESPVNILVYDPRGRRLGFDPLAATVINEIGPGTYYSGPDTEPQLIDIGNALPGTYTVTGIGTGVGPYTLTLTRADEDGEILETQVTNGIALPGQQIVPFSTEILLPVPLDLKPGNFPNSVNPRSRGLIPVAILTTDTLDASIIDPSSIRFGPKGAKEAHNKGHLEDVNRDGRLDLILHFETQETGIRCRDKSVSLTGETKNGEAIEGVDYIVTVGCK